MTGNEIFWEVTSLVQTVYEKMDLADSVILRHLVPIGQTDAEIWPFLNFSRWRRQPSWISKSSKF